MREPLSRLGRGIQQFRWACFLACRANSGDEVEVRPGLLNAIRCERLRLCPLCHAGGSYGPVGCESP